MKQLFFFISLMIAFGCFGQKKHNVSIIDQLYNKDIKASSIPSFLLSNPNIIQDKTLDYIASNYLQTENRDTLFKSVKIIQSVYELSTIIEIKEVAVEILCKHCNSNEVYLKSEIFKTLKNFEKRHFTKVALDSLQNNLRNQNTHLNELILILGFAGNQETKQVLQNFYYTENLKQRTKWYIHLALARLGDVSQTEYCINKVRKLPVDDFFMYEVLPEIIYIKQPQLNPLFVHILKDTDKNCTNADPENPKKIHCGYRLIEIIAPVFKNYPLDVTPSGDLAIDDYKKATFIVLDWLENNTEFLFNYETY